MAVDRDYRQWTGPLPAITLCYHDHMNVEKANKIIQQVWNVTEDDVEYFYFMEFLVAMVNASMTNYVDLTRFSNDERFDDLELADIVKFIDQDFQVDIDVFDKKSFMPSHKIMTENGMCYVFNSAIGDILETM